MEVIYRPGLCQKKSRSKRQSTYDKHRQTGKLLKVVSIPQNGDYVPSIRVAGKWLETFGLKLGDEVILIADEGRILITKKS